MIQNTIESKRQQLQLLQSQLKKPETISIQEPVAIVGLHGFLPNAMNIQSFWDYLDKDISVISKIPTDRCDWHPDETPIKWGGFIPNVKNFDPAFFNILPQDADLIDPQQRLLLMSMIHTIENAGYNYKNLKKSRTGVYVAIEDNEYLEYLKYLKVNIGLNVLNHHPSMAANRISYFLDLRGPSEIINTMCSSAAVAIHKAVTAIQHGEIETALVGGARVILNPAVLTALSKMGILTHQNTVKSFGIEADGYIRAEGVGSIMLKPLSSAKKDNNPIYAIIKSSAINYNGQGGMSIAAPNKESHIEVIKNCYKKAGVDIRDISYIEAQGMGNQISDIMEWESCNTALESLCLEDNLSFTPGYCHISTLKPMIGHMECVSALGALFKIIRSMQTDKIHKVLHLSEINPYLNTQNRPCQLATETIEWKKTTKPRLAGLHSYGSGGNNAHLLIEEYRENSPKPTGTQHQFNLHPYWVTAQKNETQHEKKRICIIGAGPSGLVMAKSLLEEGHIPVVFEKQSVLGGLWVLNKNKEAGAYKKTRFQSSKFTSIFSDFYNKDVKSYFYSVEEIQAYLIQYANHFKLNDAIQYQSEVTAVEEINGKWTVEILKNGRTTTEIFDGVAMCQGSFWQPYTPSKKGLDQFKGLVMHSGSYFDNEIFKDKNVLIVGNGVSAMDIAEEAALVSKNVYWSRRSNKLILPRMVGFVPNDCQSPASLLIQHNRTNLIFRLKQSMPDYYQTYVKSGILPTEEEFNDNPIVHINDHIVQLVSDGKIHVKPDIDYFSDINCYFKDGTTISDIDIIVFSTGYKNIGSDDFRTHYLKNISIKDDFSMGIFYEKNPSLVNVSVLPIAFTGSFYFMEMVARWYAQLNSGRFKLTNEELKSRITSDHYLIMAPISSVLFALRLGLFPRPEKEFKEFWRLLNYPAFPMINRLRGIHADPKAAETLAEFIKTSYVKTDNEDPELRIIKYKLLAGLTNEDLNFLRAKNEITQDEYLAAFEYKDSPLILNWESQYIKFSQHTLKNESISQEILFDDELIKIISDILRLPPKEINLNKNLSEYGFDSIALTNLANSIQEKFPFVKFKPSTFLEHPTLSDLSNYINKNHQEKSLNPISSNHKFDELVTLQTGTPGKNPIFFFHAALGTVHAYSALIKHFDPSIPVYAIQSQGIRGNAPAFDNIEKMSEHYVKIILSLNSGHDFHLAGYSQGGVIAYEVAKKLQQQNQTVKHIIMIDSPYPPILSFISHEYQSLLTLVNLLHMHQKGHLSDINFFDFKDPANYLQEISEFGIKQGLPYSIDELKTFIVKYTDITHCNIHSMKNYKVDLLPIPHHIHCHYLYRKDVSTYFPKNEPIRPEIKKQELYYANSHCKERWKVIMPNFHSYSLNSYNHFDILENESSLSLIAHVCKEIYA